MSPFPRLNINVNGLTADLINNEILNATKTNQNFVRPKTVNIFKVSKIVFLDLSINVKKYIIRMI